MFLVVKGLRRHRHNYYFICSYIISPHSIRLLASRRDIMRSC